MSEFNPSPEFEEKVRKAAAVPEANPEFVNKLHAELARRPVRMKSRFVLKPAWVIAFVLVALALIASAPVAVEALKRLFGYLPGVGLVENPGGMRVLAEPASVTRDGVTLTVTQALVYADYVQLVYEVRGIAPENDSTTFTNKELNSIDQNDFCGAIPYDEAKLRLSDGTLIDRALDTDKYPENIFAMKPAFETSLAPDMTEVTFVLKCIPWARLGAVPENWEMPLKLKYVPAGEVIGQPVVEVTPSDTSSAHDQGITVSLDKVVPHEGQYSFYFTVVPDEKKESLSILYPASAYLIDATGQKISLIDNHPFPGTHDFAEPWELQTVSKPGYSPYKIVINKIDAYYDIPTPAVFEFDTGENPQVGQVWPINQTLKLNGADVKVISAKFVEKDLADWGLSSHTQGFEFTFESADGKTPIYLDIMDFDLDHIMGGILPADFNSNGGPSVNPVLTLIYEKGVPSGKISVAINRETVMLSGNWEFEWTSPDQTGVTLLDRAQAVPSTENASGASASLEKVVKLTDGYLFYIDMKMLETNPDLRVVAPGNVYVIDSTGKKISLQLNAPQVYWATDANIWEFSTKETIAEGPIQILIEQAKAYYNPWDISVPPTAEMTAPYSFTFDVGSDPQIGQTWTLNQEFEIGGYTGKVTSVRAVAVDSNMLSSPYFLGPDRSINSGYEFTVQSVDPSIRWNVGISMDRPQGSTDGFVDCIGYLPGEPGTVTTYTVPCRGLPNQTLQATIYEISVSLDGIWEMDWNLPAQ